MTETITSAMARTPTIVETTIGAMFTGAEPGVLVVVAIDGTCTGSLKHMAHAEVILYRMLCVQYT